MSIRHLPKLATQLTLSLLLICGARQATAAEVWVVGLQGAIGPAYADYFIRALERGEEEGIDLLVLRLDTPGGLDKSMRDMIKAILASRVPVATYVAPNGSRAASAGTYIMYASHVAAMAPRDQHRLLDPGQHRRRRRLAVSDPRRARSDWRRGRRRGHGGRRCRRRRRERGCPRRRAAVRHGHGAQGGQRRRFLYQGPRRVARAQCRVGGSHGARSPPT